MPTDGRVPRAQDAQERPMPTDGRVPRRPRTGKCRGRRMRTRAAGAQEAQERPMPRRGENSRSAGRAGRAASANYWRSRSVF